MTMKNDKKSEEEPICRFKIDIKNLTNFDSSTRKSRKCTLLMGCFWPNKVYNVWAKKVQRSCFMKLESDARFEEKLTCGLENNIFTKVLESLKIGTFMGVLLSKVKCMSLKPTVELCFMVMKKDAKFKKKLTCQFKVDMRNLTIFDPRTRKSQKFAL